MKIIYLIRHAEAEIDTSGMPDYKRPLTKRGFEAVNKLGIFLNNVSARFDIIITSHAVRAMETARNIAVQTAFPENKIRMEQKIYNAHGDTYADLICDQPDELDCLAVIGHNPHITYFANYFLKQKMGYLPASGMIALGFEANCWADICHADCELLNTWVPD